LFYQKITTEPPLKTMNQSVVCIYRYEGRVHCRKDEVQQQLVQAETQNSDNIW